jgi:hypothetical protein
MKTGDLVQNSRYRLAQKITTLDDFWYYINTYQSIYARHRIYSSAFFFSWHIKTIKQWIDNGYFYTVIDLRK